MAIRTYISGDLPTSNKYIKMRIECVLNSQDIAANTSNITVNIYFRRTNTGYTTYGNGTCYCKLDGTEYTQAVSNSQVISYSTGNGICLFSRSFTLSHNADGARSITLQGKVSLPNTSLGGDYQSFSVTLPTIPRTSTCNAPNLTIGDNLTISISRASTSFVHTLIFAFGGVEQALYNVGASGTFALSNIASSLYAVIPNASSGKYTLTCHTHAGVNGAHIGSVTVQGNVYVNAGRAAPVFSDFAFSATRSDLTGNNQRMIAGVSDLTVTISAANRAVSNSAATIRKYIVTAGGKTAEIAWSGSAAVSATISKPTAGTISVAAVDSRGNQTVVTKLATVVAYAAPKITSMSVTRANSVDTAVTLTVSGTWWGQNFGAVANTLSMTYAYKQTNASTWSSAVTLLPATESNKISLSAAINGDLGVSGFTADASFDVCVSITDKINTITISRALDRGIPTMHLTRDGAAIGKTLSSGLPTGSLEVKGGVYAGNDFVVRGISTARIFDQLGPCSISIPSNASINTTTYLNCGNYAVEDNSAAQTITGLPIKSAGVLKVSMGTGTGNLWWPAGGAWQYRIRRYIAYSGISFVQDVSSDGNGAITYGRWRQETTFGARNFVKSFTGTSALLDFTADIANAGITGGVIAQVPYFGNVSSSNNFTSMLRAESTGKIWAYTTVNQTYQVYLIVFSDYMWVV